MSYYIGIDVSCKESVISVVDDSGRECRKGACLTTVDSIHNFFRKYKVPVKGIAIETGTECHHLARGLLRKGYDVKVVEARKGSKIMPGFCENKNDKNDAYALAQILRTKLYHEVRPKEPEQLDLRALTGARRKVVDQRVELVNQIRGLAKTHGVKLQGAFSELRWRELIVGHASLSDKFKSTILVLLDLLVGIEQAIKELDQQVNDFVKSSAQAQNLLTVPGVGPVLATTFLGHLDTEQVFSRSRDVGAFVGMTPRESSSGQKTWRGKISKCGPQELRNLLMQGGMTVVVSLKKDIPLKKWATQLAARKGKRLAATAVGRRLAVTMYRIMQTGKPYDPEHNTCKEAQAA